MRIEVCGGIASGKTTFARALAAHDTRFTAVCEDFSSNTFLSDFYTDVSMYAYETEISFLLQHMHQIKAARGNHSKIVCDFSIEQDYSYAINNLETPGQLSFIEVYKETIRQIMPPDLLVLIQCPTQILLKRIHARGRNNEKAIDGIYLDSTIQALNDRVAQLNVNTIILDSNRYDFRKPNDIRKIMMEIMYL